MRCFIGIKFSDEVNQKLEQSILNLEGNKTLKNNFHLTLAFLGEINNEELSLVKEVMDNLTSTPFIIKTTKTTMMRDIFVLELDESNQLTQIHEQIINSLMAKNFKIEKRKIYPHITLMRKYNGPRIVIKQMIEEVNKITLFLSTRVAGNLTYKEIYAKNLKGV